MNTYAALHKSMSLRGQIVAARAAMEAARSYAAPRGQGRARSDAAAVTSNTILKCLAKSGDSTVQQLADATGLKYSTVAEHLRGLVEEGRAETRDGWRVNTSRVYRAVAR